MFKVLNLILMNKTVYTCVCFNYIVYIQTYGMFLSIRLCNTINMLKESAFQNKNIYLLMYSKVFW